MTGTVRRGKSSDWGLCDKAGTAYRTIGYKIWKSLFRKVSKEMGITYDDHDRRLLIMFTGVSKPRPGGYRNTIGIILKREIVWAWMSLLRRDHKYWSRRDCKAYHAYDGTIDRTIPGEFFSTKPYHAQIWFIVLPTSTRIVMSSLAKEYAIFPLSSGNGEA